MQTRLTEELKHTALGQEADSILRSCVHCGFCNATCPTYQLLGDELDGPRGRIYLIKQIFEGETVTQKTQQHLDRCLTCRSCETTCPSGVQYGKLLDAGREIIEQRVNRPLKERLARWGLLTILPHPGIVSPLLNLSRWLSPLLPQHLKRHIPSLDQATVLSWPESSHNRRMLVLDGCVQSVTNTNINAASARLLDRLGISLMHAKGSVCCGAVSQHMTAPDKARDFMRRNIDVWWPQIEQGVEAIVTTASACGVMVKDYGHMLRDDAGYSEKAVRVSELARDISEVLASEDLALLQQSSKEKRVAVHTPCTLQHGQQLPDSVQEILRACGFDVTKSPDGHLCCGAAGTYSILQPEISRLLLQNKLNCLQEERPEMIATANIGCLLHMQQEAEVPVMHWVELLERSLD